MVASTTHRGDGCRIERSSVAGWLALTLVNDSLRVTVLPEKGADIYSFLDAESGVDVLLKTPWGLLPKGAPPRRGSGDLEFLWNYEGAWQELFPSAGDPCRYQDRRIPFHGEVALLPWLHDVLVEGPDEVALRLTVACRQTPFALERRMRVRAGEPSLSLEERVTNLDARPAHLVWGHHCVLGPPFLEEGCRLDVPAASLVTSEAVFEDTARVSPGQRGRWPIARTRDGGSVDLRDVPGPGAGSHDDVYLTDLAEGRVSVRNPRLGLTFSLGFDEALFRCVVVWQPYGGARAMPLTGTYGLGIEPWTSRWNLEQALAHGEAVTVDGGASLETTLIAALTGDGRPVPGRDR